MPRAPRVHFPGALFHVMSRGNGGQKVFLANEDYSAFLEILADVKDRKPFKLYAYCLMPNHFHLLLEVDKFPISIIMQRLITRYSKYFNIRRKRLGHVFQGRYKAILCQKDSYLLELVRYIHLNPVRAHLMRSPAAWPWSGHREYEGTAKKPLLETEFPLSLLHKQLDTARTLYAKFVKEGLGIGHQEDFYPSPSFPCMGDTTFQEEARERLAKVRPPKPNIKLRNLDELGRAVAKRTGVPLNTLRSGSRRRLLGPAKRQLVKIAFDHGFKNSDIAAFLNCTPSSVSKIFSRLEQ